MTALWRCAWREQPDGAPIHTPEPEHYDTEEQAIERAEEIARTRRLVGVAVVYQIEEDAA